MKTQTTKNSNASFVLLVILLIGIIIVSSSIGLYAWARYSSSQGGKGLASIAKWHFEVRPGSANGSPQSTFAITRTDGYSHIAEGTLAPGTYGVIPIEIDTTHTEVTMIYEIIIQLVDCPANLKFYGSCTVDGDSRVYETELIKTKKTINEQEVDEIIISKYLSLDENADDYVDQMHYENIYWEWPYETLNGDVQDNTDQGKEVLISITVTGTEVLEKPVLGNKVKIGDYVNYDANSNGVYTHTTSMDLAGTAVSESFTTAESVDWRVLSINPDTKAVTLMASKPILKTESTTETKSVNIYGINGYKNVETELNNIGSIYGHGKGAESAESIDVQDIMQYSAFDPKTYYYQYYKRVGESRTFEHGRYIKGEIYVDENGEKHDVVTGGVDQGDGTVIATSTYPVTVIQTAYSTVYTSSNPSTGCTQFTEKDPVNGINIHKMFFDMTANDGYYWLARRCTYVQSNGAGFSAWAANVKENLYNRGIRELSYFAMGLGATWESSQYYTSSYTAGFIPVVTLNPDILTSGQDSNGVWRMNI